MPPRVRKSPAADDTVYHPGRPAPRQKHLTAPRRRIVSQPLLRAGGRRRQITLTQIERGASFDGVTIGDSEDEFEEPRPKKRARRISSLPGKTESQNTLTQIGWISTIPPSDSEEDEETSEASSQDDDDESGEEDESKIRPARESRAIPPSDDEFEGFSDGDAINPGEDEELEPVTAEKPIHKNEVAHMSKVRDTRKVDSSSSSPNTSKRQPQTPRKVRRQEIPSSQSPPVTPLSAIRTHERRRLLRSPLQPLSANPQSQLDTPSRSRKSAASPGNRSTRKKVGFLEQLTSSIPEPQRPGSSVIEDSEDEDEGEGEGEDDEEEQEDVTEVVAGIDIGQETQAYIRRIDFNCDSTRATAEPDPAEEATGDEEGEPEPPPSSVNRSFNFDEDAHEDTILQYQDPPEVESPQPECEPPAHDTTLRAIKQEPQTQPLWANIPNPDPSQSTPHTSPTANHPPSSLHQSQASTRAGTTQTTPHSHVPSSPFRETYYTLPASQPTQLHLKQILLRPQTQTQQQQPHPPQVSTQDATTQNSPVEDEQQRVPDSQENVVPSSLPAEEDRGRRAVGVDGQRVVTATQLLPEGMADYSLPPPPPWTQTQETEDEDE